MTPLSSVAILEKLALLRIAFCKAPVFSKTSLRRTSVMTSTVPAARHSASLGGSSGGFIGLIRGSFRRPQRFEGLTRRSLDLGQRAQGRRIGFVDIFAHEPVP